MRIYVYAGYYELYISSKQLAKPLMYQADFNTVEEAENFIEQNFYDDPYYVEQPIFEQSNLYRSISSAANYESIVKRYTFTTDDKGNIYSPEEDC